MVVIELVLVQLIHKHKWYIFGYKILHLKGQLVDSPQWR